MLWYVSLSLTTCGATLIGVLGVLALSSFYIYDHQKNIPSDTTDDWMCHVTALVPLAVVFALSSAYGFYVILTKNRKWFFLGLIIWNFLCFGTCVYFTVAFSLQQDEPKLKADALFTKTQADIKHRLAKDGGKTTANNDGKFIPIWLDNIQNKSKECCGVRGFRDWEEFWPANENEVPKSCCKEPNNAEKCLTNLISIPFPGVPTMFIKTDTGCMDEINEHLRKNIHDCFIFLIVLSVLFGLAELTYLLQYFLDYGSGSGRASSDDGGGDTTATAATPPPTQRTMKSRLVGFFRRKPKAKADEEGATSAGDAYDLSGVASGTLTDASAYTASQGTLPGSSVSQDPFYSKGTIFSETQPTTTPQQDLGSPAASSGSDVELGPDGLPGEIKKKKKKKHKKKHLQDDMAGSDGADGKLNRQEVFLVPDKMSPESKGTGSKNDYRNDFQAANQSNDLLAMNGYAPATNSNPNQASPPGASPTGSQDDVGDKLAPGLRPRSTSKKDKLMGFLAGPIQKKKK